MPLCVCVCVCGEVVWLIVVLSRGAFSILTVFFFAYCIAHLFYLWCCTSFPACVGRSVLFSFLFQTCNPLRSRQANTHLRIERAKRKGLPLLSFPFFILILLHFQRVESEVEGSTYSTALRHDERVVHVVLGVVTRVVTHLSGGCATGVDAASHRRRNTRRRGVARTSACGATAASPPLRRPRVVGAVCVQRAILLPAKSLVGRTAGEG